jgi:hypothetical protein
MQRGCDRKAASRDAFADLIAMEGALDIGRIT